MSKRLKVLVQTCGDERFLEKTIRLFSKFIENGNCKMIVRPGSVKCLCGPGKEEALAEAVIMMEGVGQAYLIAHDDCRADESEESRLRNLCEAKKIFEDKFRGIPIVMIYAELPKERNGNEITFYWFYVLEEMGKRVFSKIDHLEENGETVFSET